MTLPHRLRTVLLLGGTIITQTIPFTSAQTLARDSAVLGCANLVLDMNFDLMDLDRYDQFFRNDSIMILPQAGTYQGVESIKEYVGFTTSSHSPYFSKDALADYAFEFKGYDATTGLCEANSYLRNDYVFDETRAAYAAEVGVAAMAKIYYDPVEHYVPRVNVYYAEPWLVFFFDTMLHTPTTQRFLCRDVMQHSCGWTIDNCQDRLAALPALTDQGYADGNCVGCRALHGAFALTNPQGHCPHVSLSPTRDPNGKTKCQVSQNISVSDLFSKADLDAYWKMAAEFGINGTLGYVENAPYYRTFRRVYEDTMLLTPPVSGLLQTLVFPGVAAQALTLSDPQCPTFQNDTTYWTDFASIELSETHLDYVQPRRLAGDVVFGPGTCTVSYTNYEDIKKRLAEMPRRLAEGTAYRSNELGKNRLNTKTFESDNLWSKGYVGQALGVPNKDHNVIRPVWDALFGDDNTQKGIFGEMLQDSGNRWSYSELVASARAFLQDKDRIHAQRDPSIWVLGTLQQIALGKEDASEAELEAFLNLRDVALYFAFLPEDSVDQIASSLGASVELGLMWKRGTVSNYEEILATSPLLAEVRDIIGDDPVALEKASWAILDTFLFAGGLGVPHTILHSVASYYDGFVGKENFDIHDTTNLKLLVMESIRRYPPVSSVPIMDARDHHRSLAFIGASGYNDTVYGDHVKSFRIRGDLQWYHQRSLHFAEPGLPVSKDSPETARVCPGRSLAVAMTAAWMKALDLETWCVAAETPIKRIPLEFAGFEMVRRGTEGGQCWETLTPTADADSGANSRVGISVAVLGTVLIGYLVG